MLGNAGSLNPYRSSEIAVDGVFRLPSGKTLRAPAFYDGTRGWKLRFYARETGECSSKIEVRARGATTEFDGPTFSIDHSMDRGMVRLSKKTPRYLELDNGEGFFIIGQNVCFTSDVAKSIPCNEMSSEDLPWNVAYKRWFGRMGKNGANWARIWMRPNFTLEAGKPWDWSLDNARKVDRIMELGRNNNLYICLCFNSERSDTGRAMGGCFPPFAAASTTWEPLLAGQGLTFGDFGTNPLAKEMYRDKIRYIIARWGAYTNLGAWELWNEIDCVEFAGAVEWSKEMTAYIRKTDPWEHLIKASGSTPYDAPIWGIDHGDINDVHPYFGWGGEEEPKNLGTFLTAFTEQARNSLSPYIVGETGIAREVTTKYGLAGDLVDQDTTGFHVYEGLYGGLFAGAVGTGLPWWWDEHVDRHNAYGRFKSVRNFVAGIDFAKEAFTVGSNASLSSAALGVQYLTGKSAMLIWIRQKARNWFTVAVEKRQFMAVASAHLTIQDMDSGVYRIEFWSPEAGKRLKSSRVVVGEDRICRISLPAVETDLALRLFRR